MSESADEVTKLRARCAALQKEHTAVLGQLHDLRAAQSSTSPSAELAEALASARAAQQRADMLSKLNAKLEASKRKAQGDAVELATKLKDLTAKHVNVVSAHENAVAALEKYEARAHADNQVALETIRGLEARLRAAEDKASRTAAHSEAASSSSEAKAATLAMDLADERAAKAGLVAERDRLARSLAASKAKTQDAERARADAEAGRDAAKVQCAALEAQNRTLRRDLDQAREGEADSRSASRHEAEEVARLQAEIKRLREAHALAAQTGSQLQNSKHEAEALRGELEKARSKNSVLRGEVDALAEQVAQANQDALDAEADAADARVEAAAAHDALAAAQAASETVADRIRTVEAALAEHQALAAAQRKSQPGSNNGDGEGTSDKELESLVAALRSQLDALKQAQENESSASPSLSLSSTSSSAAANPGENEPKPESQGKSHQVEALREEVESLRARQSSMRDDHARALEELRAKYEAIRAAEAETMGALRSDLQQAKEGQAEAEAQVASLRGQLAAVTAALEEKKTAHAALDNQKQAETRAHDERVGLRAANAELASQLQGLTDHWTELAAQYESRIRDLNAAQAAYKSSADAALASYKAALADTKGDLETARQRVRTAEAERDGLVAQLESAQDDRDEAVTKAKMAVATQKTGNGSESTKGESLNVQAIREQVLELEADLGQVTQVAAERKSHIADLHARHAKLSSLYEEQVTSLQRAQNQYKLDVSDALTQLASVTAERDSLQATLQAMEKQARAPMDDKKRRQSEEALIRIRAERNTLAKEHARVASLYEEDHVALVQERSKRAQVVRTFESRIEKIEAMIRALVASLKAQAPADANDARVASLEGLQVRIANVASDISSHHPSQSQEGTEDGADKGGDGGNRGDEEDVQSPARPARSKQYIELDDSTDSEEEF